jgi:cytidyltransferase-like protein
MNLGQQIAKALLEQDKPTIALFPGAFKPPHKGHLEVVKQLLDKADQVVVLISPKTRDGVTADESAQIWDLYKTIINGDVEIKISEESPIREVYNVIKDNPDTNFILATGKGEVERFKNALQFPNVKVFDAGVLAGEGVNATSLRVAIKSGNETDIEKYIPQGINVADFISILDIKPPVQEVNHQTQDDTFTALVDREEGEIERTADVFNIPLEDLKYAFIAGSIVILSDDIWSKLENTDSYQVTSIDDAVKLAKQYGKDWKSVLTAIKDGTLMDPPMILNYDKTRYYLVSGNTRLMFYKALGVIPKVLLATIDLPNEKAFYLTENKLNEEQTGTIGEFIKYTIKNLGLQNPPSSLTLSYNNKQAKEKRTFGYFDPNTKKIWVYVKNRNMADILRTLAHEMIHRKQEEDGRLDIKSGETGSPIEDEANAMAGVLLRNFGKINNSIYEGLKKKPINELDFNLNKSYDWKFKGGVDNKYTFTTGQTEYEVLFFPVGVSSKGVFERLYRPISEDNMVGTIPLNATNEFKVLEINATVMNITLDFLNKNKQWKDVMISPIEKRRYNIVKGFLDKHLPSKYFKDEEEGIFHIYRKIK